MKTFRTDIKIPQSNWLIKPNSMLFLTGSCFSEYIGQYFSDARFNIGINPMGILFNPKSIANSLDRIVNRIEFVDTDLDFHNGLYHSFHHHGRFSSPNKTEMLEAVNSSLISAHDRLRNTDYLFITFGTAYVYEHIEKDMVVANCHKFPSSDFKHYRLSIEDIVAEYTLLIKQLLEINSNLKIAFTVSPVRHLKDGAHENQLSKATLLLAIERLTQDFEQAFYFPAFELVLDDLRDYRFYNSDMVHPNSLAIDYVWEHLKNFMFSKDAFQFEKEMLNFHRLVSHRVLHLESATHQLHIAKIKNEQQRFAKIYPFVDFDEEKP